MARFGLKATFTRGEITPLAHARTDIEMYQSGAETVHNFHVLKEGGLRRRSGTRYRGATKVTTDVRLVDFVFATDDAFVIEAGPSYCRFWQDGARVMDGASPYEIVSPFDATALANMDWEQTGDTVFFAYANHTIKPQQLTRDANGDWAFSDAEFVDGPYLPINSKQNALTTDVALTAIGLSVVLTWENTLGINGGAGLLATDVGRAVRMQFNGKWSWAVITAVSSTTVATATLRTANLGGGAGTPSGELGGGGELSTGGSSGSTQTSEFVTLSWRLGAFSQTTGYPGAVAIHAGRVFWGGTPLLPRFVGYSYSGYPTTFSPSAVDGTVTDANGGAVDIVAGRADKILWMRDSHKLLLGTAGAVRSLGSPDQSVVFGPRSIDVRTEVKQGVSSVRPAPVGPSLIHAGRYGTRIQDLIGQSQYTGLDAPDLSIVSDHLYDSGISELHYAEEPNRVLWSVLGDGTLTATTINRTEKIIGFSRHTISEGTVISAAVIPAATQDEPYFVVRRTVNGSTVQYIETLDKTFERNSLQDAFFVDCGGTYTGAATNTVSGITWLEGKTVSVLADGFVMPDAVITGGVLTLAGGMTATVIHFGLPFTSTVKLLRAPEQNPDGSALGQKRRGVFANIDMYETQGITVLSNTGQSDEVLFRTTSTSFDAPEPLFTGVKKVLLDGSWESGGQFSIVAARPLPATIRAINIGMESEP